MSAEVSPRVASVCAAHRAVADLLWLNPALPNPVVTDSGTIHWSLWEFQCPDGVPAMVAAIRRAVGGKWDKEERNPSYTTPQMWFTRDGFAICVERETVCARRVVGTETVTVPAVEARPERTEEREIFEWDCTPVLAAEVVAS